MRVLCGGPAREVESELFQLHRTGLVSQEGDFELEVRHELVPDPGGPRWGDEKIDRVAKAREMFLEEARPHYDFHDALFMVDTDVVLGPGVLARLLEVDADVVYGIFWTYSDWGGLVKDWPQVWDRHPYHISPKLENGLRMWRTRDKEFTVYGGGACTLIRGRGFESHYWPRLKSLPREGMWIGEDRSYCLGLESRGIKQVAVTGLEIAHVHPPKDAEEMERARSIIGRAREARVVPEGTS